MSEALEVLRATIAVLPKTADYPAGPHDVADTTPEERAREHAELRRLDLLEQRQTRPLLGYHGGDRILSAPQMPESLWGEGDEVAAAKGEATVFFGPPSSMKSVLLQNLMLRMIEVVKTPLLGYPVAPVDRFMLFALDRKNQILRSIRRQIGTSDRDHLNERLVIWDEPLPRLLDQDPELLAAIALENHADAVALDSLKDVLSALSDEEAALGFTRAIQLAIAAGVEVFASHHDRKIPSVQKQRPVRLDDAIGSRFLTASLGSVLALTGSPGGPVIELRQLKAPATEIGPLRLTQDFNTGEIKIFDQVDLRELIRDGRGLTASEAARALFDKSKPTPNEVEKARRRLQHLVDRNLAVERKGSGPVPSKWYPIVKGPHE